MTLSNDPLITDPQLRQLLGGCSAMTVWRWRKAGLLPKPIVVNGRNFTRSSVLDQSMARIIGDEHPQADGDLRRGLAG